MKQLKTLVACLLLLIGSASQAQSVREMLRDWLTPTRTLGTWECADCTLPARGVNTDGADLGDLQVFIQANNDAIWAEQRGPRGWKPGDQITICNAGGTCITLHYQPLSALWLPKAPSYAKPPGVQPKKPPPAQNGWAPSLSDSIYIEATNFILCEDCGFTIYVNGRLVGDRVQRPSVTVREIFSDRYSMGADRTDYLEAYRDEIWEAWDFSREDRDVYDWPDRTGECDRGCR
jgi:hypothetical protein